MNKILVIVNLENDYIIGPMAFPSEKKLDELIFSASFDYDDVVLVLERHSKDYLNTQMGEYLPTPHSIEGTDGVEIYGKIKELKPKKIFYTETFGSLELGEWLKENYYDEIHFSGLYSHISVMEDAIIAKNACPMSKVRIIRELVDTNDKGYEENAYNILRSCHVEVK